MKYHQIESSLFVENRKKFTKQLKPNSLAIFHSNDQMPRTGDQMHLFSQDRNLFWLTGIDQEESILILFPDAPREDWKEVLFVKKTSDLIRIWEGDKYTQESAAEASGIKNVLWLDEFEVTFSTMMHYAENVYLDLNEHDRFASPVEYRSLRMAHKVKADFPLHEYERSYPIMADLRAIKSDIEVELMRQACNITKKGFERLLKFVKPGVKEFEIEAELAHEFLRNRATGFAYHPIIATGANAVVLHYEKNNSTCKEGELILMDIGAEYANYSSDMTRCVPVSGRFTERQKNVYNAVLRVMRESIKMLRPGNTLEEYHIAVGQLIEKELVDLGLLTMDEVRNRPAGKSGPRDKNAAYRKYFMHGTSHFIGLDTHDVGNWYKPMKAGMVFTCEPGIYIREEGLGIRLENDILITENGLDDLMADIPLEVEEIEEHMNS